MARIVSLNYTPLREAVQAKKETWGNLRALGAMTGVSYSALSRFLEAGASPSIINLLRLCDYCEISVADLVERERPVVGKRKAKPAAKEARP